MKNFYILIIQLLFTMIFIETGDIWLDERMVGDSAWVHEDAQNWKLHLDKTDSTVAFENVHWRGYYLGADDDVYGWLELRSQRKIKWTANSTSSEISTNAPTTEDNSSEISTNAPTTEDNSSEISSSAPTTEDSRSEVSTSALPPVDNSSEN